MSDPSSLTGALRAQLRRGALTVPSCYDALGFRMLARAGFPAAFLSGFSVSATRLGVPDAGLLSYGEMLAQARDVASSAPMPLIVDADTGFGNAQNVQRSVRGLADAGAACLMLEDQESPKRDFGAPGAVVPRAEALRRVKAAVRARDSGADILIIGRSDARRAAGEASGLEETLWRIAAFTDVGVDLIFATGVHEPAEMARVRAASALPQLVQVDLPGGPALAPADIHRLGFEIALYGVTFVFAAAGAFRDAILDMKAGRQVPAARAISPAELSEIVGVPEYLAVDRDLER